MRLVSVLAGCLVACGGSGTFRPPPAVDNGDTGHAATFVPDDVYKPTYLKANLATALEAERAKVTELEQQIAASEADGGDRFRTLLGDLAVRRRFIATLQVCQDSGRDCPPRLDEPAWTFEPDSDAKPPLDAVLRFDREDWIKVAAELHGRACACRTVACLDSLTALIDQLETEPTRDVQGDEAAAQSIVWARECMFRLRGKRPGAPHPAEP